MALEKLAAAIGWPLASVEAALEKQISAERDDQGRLVGFGLTLRPTAHRCMIRGRTLFGWCADDTLMFPVILGHPAVVESTCPGTGQSIRIELTPDMVERVDPPGAVVSAVRPTGRLADPRSASCQYGHFFSSTSAAAHWAKKHPDGMLHPVEDAFRMDQEIIRQLGWNAPREQHD